MSGLRGRPSIRYAWIIAACFGVLLVGCSSAPPKPPPPPPPPKPPPVVMIELSGSADQNPDVNGAASPVAVRIIQLVETGSFERADVFALMDHEQQTLGSEEAGSQELVLAPSEHRSIKIDPKPGVTAIGVAALYRAIDDAQWRADAPVAPNGVTKLVATIGKLTVTLKPAP